MATRDQVNPFYEQMSGIYVGIDLALPGRRRTGVGVLNTVEPMYFVNTLSSREELVSFALGQKPSFVCIDAPPLGLPRHGFNRLIEIKARKLGGLRLLPPLLGSMRLLTMYGIQVANYLRQVNIKVLEVHPTSTLKVLGMDRQGFMRIITSSLRAQVSNVHEIDALVSAFTCLLHDHGCTEALTGYGDDEGALIIPRSDCEIQVLLRGYA
ncbi:hypothetical protein [Vulcanisaeta souniana]|uniref:DUF429 domain-containing protein n=1 Tax=Vulcanisaeta souniana TaxID=164452 RepID=UPI0006CFBF16|nr:hypothetical protein [Vulcanisaeta souniana]